MLIGLPSCGWGKGSSDSPGSLCLARSMLPDGLLNMSQVHWSAPYKPVLHLNAACPQLSTPHPEPSGFHLALSHPSSCERETNIACCWCNAVVAVRFYFEMTSKPIGCGTKAIKLIMVISRMIHFPMFQFEGLKRELLFRESLWGCSSSNLAVPGHGHCFAEDWSPAIKSRMVTWEQGI